MGIRTLMTHHSVSIGMAKIQNTDDSRRWQGRGATVTFTRRWGSATLAATVEDSLTTFWKTKYTRIPCPSNHAPWCLPKRGENLCLYKNLHTNVYSSFIHHCRSSEATMMSCGG